MRRINDFKQIYVVTVIFILSLLWGNSALLSLDETVVKIAGDANTGYFKPEVKISPNGDIYVIYQALNESSGRSDVHLSKYSSNGKVSFVRNLSNSSSYSYEPEIDIRGNGDVHTVWCEQSGDTHTIQYRYFNGSSWSATQDLGHVDDTEIVEDVRIAVDQSGNVFVVFMHWNVAKCKFISKYGSNISFESWPLSGRSKHPDVVVDSNYVHIIYQYRETGDEYTIAYNRRANQRNSNWESWIDLEFYGVQRPRMDLDSSGVPHAVFFENFGSTRNLWYKKRSGNKFDSLKIMTNPAGAETYHYCEILADNENNVLVTMQRGGTGGGKFVGYNWLRNGKWSGYSSFSKSAGLNPTKQSADIINGEFYAAVTFCERDDAVWLLIAEEDGNPGGGGSAPTANFTFSPLGGHAPLNVTFDAQASSDEDGQITAYNWVFGDGGTGIGMQPTHTYVNEGTYTIRLTVTDNDGKTGSTTRTIIVEPRNQPPVALFTFSPISGLLPLTVTFDASASSDPDGDVVEYDWDFDGEQTGSGAVVTHTFTTEGLKKITLAVYDDDGDSSTASGTVEVLGILPPLNIVSEAMTNRNLFTIQHVYKITWSDNPGNPNRGAVISQYNIYHRRPDENAWVFVTAIAANSGNEYYHRMGTTFEEYRYTVTAVDEQGRESELPSPSAALQDVLPPGKKKNIQ